MGISNGYINPDVIPIQLQQRPPSREESLEKGGFLGTYIHYTIKLLEETSIWSCTFVSWPGHEHNVSILLIMVG
jgi:hypothetical protein